MYKRLDRNDLCWCGSGKKYKSCHAAFDDKIINFERQGMIVPKRSLFKSEKDIEGIKKSAVINMAVLDEIGEKIHAGMSTQEIDDIVYNTTTKMGGIPADLGKCGAPADRYCGCTPSCGCCPGAPPGSGQSAVLADHN